MTDAIANLAALRGEPVEKTERFLADLAHRLVPRRLIDPSEVASLPIAETGIDWPYAYARLATGQTFYSWPSNKTRLRQFWMVRDKLPKTITADTLGIAVDVARRYACTDDAEPTDMTGWSVIEAGAYIGLRAILYAERAGRSGRVIAVEIDRANYDLMRLNIEANGMSERVAPVHAALSATDGQGEMRSDGLQKHSLAPIDRVLANSTKQVETITLDMLIDRNELGRVDYLNIQVNGAEGDVLAGLSRHVDAVDFIRIASRYDIGGEPVRPRVLAWIIEHGFTVHETTPTVVAHR